MKRLSRLLGLCLVLLMPMTLLNVPNGQAQSTSADNGEVFIIEIEDDIKAGTVLEVNRALNKASQSGADYLIIELDTPGGLLQSTRQIVDMILASDVEVVVHVHKPGGWALSAGAIILLASDYAFIHPTASIGAAEPFTPGAESDVPDEKLLQATVSWVRSLAGQNQRDPDVAERFVTENLTLVGGEAVEANIADGIAADLNSVMEALDVSGAEIQRIEQTLLGSVFNTLSNPFLVSLFLTLGALSLVMAVRSGEFMFSTAIGALLLLVGLWGIGIIEFSLIAIGLLVLGVLLLMIELFDQPGFGLFGVGGIISIVIGVLTLNEEPFYAPRVLDAVSLAALATLGFGLVMFIIISRAVAKTFKTKPTTGAEALLGETAQVLQAVSPRGRVNVEGESWQAELAEGEKPLKTSEECIIMGVKGNTLLVGSKPNKKDV